MLILLRSDFRIPETKEAFLRLMRYAHVNVDQPFEVPVVEAPGTNAIVLRLRKMQPEANSTLVMGTGKGESLEESLRVLDGVRKAIPFLHIFPHILLVRKSEWREYAQVMRAPRPIEFFESVDANVLVIEQRDEYSDLTQRMVLAYMIPPTLGVNAGKARPGEQTTTQFMLGERPTGTLPRITDEMLQEAGVQTDASIEPDAEDRITEMPPPPDVPFDRTKTR